MLDQNATPAEYIGYQVVVSIGTGLTIQVPIIIAQAISEPQDMSVATSMALCKSMAQRSVPRSLSPHEF